MSRDLRQRDDWEHLRTLTAARIALGRSGGSVPTRELLDFSAAHARARDAVHTALDVGRLVEELKELPVEVLVGKSRAGDRGEYLRRPDLGRRLSEESLREWQKREEERGEDTGIASATQIRKKERPGCDLVIVIADGLSATGVQDHAAGVVKGLVPRLREGGWSLGPVVIVERGRVAIEDEVGEVFGAGLSLILIGERPGLGSPDSLGAYLVHGPKVGKTDAERNCVSNIRPEGLPIGEGVETLFYLLTESRRRKLSGVGLKDERAGGMLGERVESRE